MNELRDTEEKVKSESENGKTKANKIIRRSVNAILIAGAFLIGAAAGSFLDPIIQINHLSPVKTMEQEIDKTKSSDVTTEVDEMLEVSYLAAQNEDLIVGAFYYEFEDIDKEFKDGDYLKHAKSEALKGFMRDLGSSNLLIKYDILSGYTVTPDINYIIDKYGDRLDEVYKTYLKFRVYELDNHLFNENTEMLNIDEIVTRIEKIEMETNKGESIYNEKYEILLIYYYDALAGKNHDFFKEYTEDEETIKDSVIKKYEDLSLRTDGVGEVARKALADSSALTQTN